jgi:hypothetical protein
MDGYKREVEAMFAARLSWTRIVTVDAPVCAPKRLLPAKKDPAGPVDGWFCKVRYGEEIVKQGGGSVSKTIAK